MTTDETDKHTREDWRELGFYYNFDKETARWQLIGSRDGLLKFRDILFDYAADPRHAGISEHDHYGPYWYLKITTWHYPLISEDDIRGSLEDLRRLGELVDAKLSADRSGPGFVIDSEFAENNSAHLAFEIREDSFDPASADPLLS